MQDEKPNQEDFFESIKNSPMSDADLLIAPQLLQGIKMLELCKLEEAFAVFKDASALSPKSFKALYLLGRTAMELEQFDDAVPALKSALDLDPGNIEVQYLIAHVHALQDLVEEAAGELLAILGKNPDFIDAYYDCGVALQILGRYQEAIKIFEKRLSFSPDFETAIMCAMTYEIILDYENTEKYYAQAMALDPKNIMVVESHGKTLLELDRYEEALKDFNAALALDPESPDALCGRGQTLFHLGNTEDALKDLKATVRLDPENMIAWGMLGQIKLYEEDYEKALKYLEKAIDIDPDLLVYDFRASAKRALGDLDGALADIKLAIEFEPENVDYLIDEGIILIQMERIDEALKVFNEALLREKTPEAYRFRGLAFMKELEYEKAIADFTEAEKLGAEAPDLFLNRGEAFYQLGEQEKGMADFQRAKKLAEEEGNVEFAKKCESFLKKMSE